jgi:hypothetical protein
MAIDIGVGPLVWIGHLAALRLFVRIKTDASFWKNFSRPYIPFEYRHMKKIFPVKIPREYRVL